MEANNTNTTIIQVVDDEMHNRKVIRNYLKKNLHNTEVIECENWEEAIQTAQNQVPNLILLDIMMPEQDGFETCKQLKEMESTRDIPVIFLSALDDVDSKKKGFQVGGVDYVSKPFQAEELISRVNTHITLQEQKHKLINRSQQLESLIQERTEELQKKIRRAEQVRIPVQGNFRDHPKPYPDCRTGQYNRFVQPCLHFPNRRNKRRNRR